ncbi:MAG: Rho termination factor N-terminal domain-containing protein, partial [Flavobacteriales bacterium]
MLDRDALNGLKLADLKELAKQLGLRKADTLKKADLVARILEAQAAKGGGEKAIGPSFRSEEELTALATSDEPAEEEEEEEEEELGPMAQGAEAEEEEDDEEDEEDGEEDEGNPGGAEVADAPSAAEPGQAVARKSNRELRQERWRERRERLRQERPPGSEHRPPQEPRTDGERAQREERREPPRQDRPPGGEGQQRPDRPFQPQREQIAFDAFVECEGVLEVMPEGYGFLRSSDYNYLASPDDVYVTQQMIKQYGLKLGDTVSGFVRPPREGDKFFPLVRIDRINGRDPE